MVPEKLRPLLEVAQTCGYTACVATPDEGNTYRFVAFGLCDSDDMTAEDGDLMLVLTDGEWAVAG